MEWERDMAFFEHYVAHQIQLPIARYACKYVSHFFKNYFKGSVHMLMDMTSRKASTIAHLPPSSGRREGVTDLGASGALAKYFEVTYDSLYTSGFFHFAILQEKSW